MDRRKHLKSQEHPDN